MMIFRRFLAMAILLVSSWSQAAESAQCNLDNDWLPVTSDIDWQTYVDDEQLNNRIQLLNVWAIWCQPCRGELPILAALDELSYIDVHLLNMGDDPDQAQAMLEELDVASLSMSVSDNPELLKDFGVVGIPLTVMFVDGKAMYRYLGILEDDEAIQQYGQCLTPSQG